MHNSQDVDAHADYFYSPSGKALRALIEKALLAKRDLSVDKSDSLEKFDLANWSAYQANEVGYRRAIKEILNLITDKVK